MAWWIRGCVFLLATTAVASDLPSGQDVTLHEVLIDKVETETWLRFRFLAPAIAQQGASVDFEAANADMDYLCASVALPYIENQKLSGDIIVISLADRPVEFGAADPDVTQFFEAYRLQDGRCIWEAY